MGKYVPTAIAYQRGGLVRDRDAFVLADDAYTDLHNIYQWRGRLKRRQGVSLLGKLARGITLQAQAAADGSNQTNIADVLTSFRATQPDAHLEPSSLTITLDNAGVGDTFTDNGSSIIARATGTTYDVYPAQTITGITQAASAVITFSVAHTFVATNKLLIQSVVGMTEINDTVVTVSGVTATTATVSLDTTAFTAYSSGGTANGSWVNYDTGEVNLTWLTGSTPAAAITVHSTYRYYPGLPVMGLPKREIATINAEQTIAFDTIYAYLYNNSASRFEELPAATPTTWSGDDTNFFWAMNYWYTSDNVPYYWVSNFSGVSGDPIRLYDGTNWHTFAPTTAGSDELHQCLMLIPYHGRVVALNTFEGATLANSLQYPQRARWCQLGAPFSSVAAGTPPVATTQWLSNVTGRGGFVDATTNEHIVSAQFVRDVLIVGFESSTWALRYTGNQLQPFVWERINRELGTESTFSMIPFDKGILSIGDKSINSCDGNSVERIDEPIPDQVFSMHNTLDPNSQVSDGLKRVHGARNFYERLVYWTFPRSETQTKFPDQVLVFNYENQTYALFDDCFTCFGEHRPFNDRTWAQMTMSWEEASFPWVSAQLQSQIPQIAAGNQQGFVVIVNQRVNNDETLFISNVTGGANPVVIESTAHTLQNGDYVYIDNILGTGGLELNGRIFQVERDASGTVEDDLLLFEKPRFAIASITQATNAVIEAPGHNFDAGDHFYIDNVLSGMTEIDRANGYVVSVSGNFITTNIDSSTYTAATATGYVQNTDSPFQPVTVQARTYLGKGTIARVQGFEANSKKFNMIAQGKKTFLGYIDVLADVTAAGEATLDIYTDYNDTQPVNDVDDTFFNNVFSTQIEQFSTLNKTKEWHRVYCQTDAQFYNYVIRLNERQLVTPKIVDSEMLVDAIIVYGEAGGRLAE